uniref:Transcriptional regulator-like domain-containing protein n=1 Tax=Achromobacter denitrificans TaxID=32002 RepID=A0A0P0UWL5_ACHDE|nr:hypothetical protein [Achromobacter denitrificans]
MVNPHHIAHWYPTAAYLYILCLDALALAWEYLRRHPDYRLDWLHHQRRPHAAQQAAHRWGLRLLEDPALDARRASGLAARTRCRGATPSRCRSAARCGGLRVLEHPRSQTTAA